MVIIINISHIPRKTNLHNEAPEAQLSCGISAIVKENKEWFCR